MFGKSNLPTDSKYHGCFALVIETDDPLGIGNGKLRIYKGFARNNDVCHWIQQTHYCEIIEDGS